MVGKIKNKLNIRNKIVRIVKSILAAALLIIAGFYGNELLRYINTKPDIDIIMPQTYDEEGIFKITLANGEKRLSNITVKIESCYMDKWNYYYPDDLPKREKYVIRFKDDKTLNRSRLLDCHYNLSKNREIQYTAIKVYRNISTREIIVPTQKSHIFKCGTCYWNISFISDKINKTFKEEMYSSVRLLITITGEDPNIVNASDVEFDSEIFISTHDYREWQMLGGEA